MIKEKGMGRTRAARFAAITVPAAAAAAGLGFAMLNGMVGAVLSSADGFTLDTGDITTSGIKMTASGTNVAGGDQAALYAETTGSKATDHLNLTTASATIPLVNLPFHISIHSTLSTPISLGNVALSAKSLLTCGGGSLSNVVVGQAVSDAGFDNAPAATTDQNSFALTSSGAADSQVLKDVKAASYAITLGSLNVDNLGISLESGAYDPATDGPVCAP